MKNQKLRKVISGIISVIMAFSMTALAACADSEDDIQGGGNGQTDITDTPDEETPDQGNPDEGNPDEENPDEGTPDEGNPDEGNPDEGNPDEGTPDDSTPDTENPDEGNPDQGTPDEENPDEGNPDEGNPDEGNPDEENPDEGTPDEGNPDDSTPDVNPDEDDFDSALYNEILEKLMALLSQPDGYAKLSILSDTDYNLKHFEYKGEDFSYTKTESRDINNFISFNIDFISGDWDLTSETTSVIDGKTECMCTYGFIRGDVSYAVSSLTPISDFSGVEISKTEQQTDKFPAESLGLLNQIMALPLPVIMSLAQHYEAIADMSEEGLSFDISAIIKGLYSDMTELFSPVTAQTTVGEILENQIVGDLVTVLTLGTTGESAAATIKEFIDSDVLKSVLNYEVVNIGQYIDYRAIESFLNLIETSLIEAEKDESAYDYMLRLLNSERFADALGLDDGVTFLQLNMEEVLELVASPLSFEEYREMIVMQLGGFEWTDGKMLINSPVPFKLPVDLQMSMEITDFVMDITFGDDGAVCAEIGFCMEGENIGLSVGSSDFSVSGIGYTVSGNGNFGLSVEYLPKSCLTDLSGAIFIGDQDSVGSPDMA